MQGGGVSSPAGSIIVSCSSPTQVCNTHFYTDLYRNAVITAKQRAAASRPLFRGSESPRLRGPQEVRASEQPKKCNNSPGPMT